MAFTFDDEGSDDGWDGYAKESDDDDDEPSVAGFAAFGAAPMPPSGEPTDMATGIVYDGATQPGGIQYADAPGVVHHPSAGRNQPRPTSPDELDDEGMNSDQTPVYKNATVRNRNFDHNGAWKERKNGAIYAGGTKAFTKEEVARCEHIFSMYDVDGSGGVDFAEFQVLFTVLRFPATFTEKAAMGEFIKFDIDHDDMLNEDEFLRLVTRELCRKTIIRRQELYGLLERGIDGGRRLQEEKEAALRGEEFDDMNPDDLLAEAGVVFDDDMEGMAQIPVVHETLKAAKSADEMTFLKRVLADHVLFVGLTEDRFNEVAHTMGTVEIPIGQLLLHEGRKNETMYILKIGEFTLTQHDRPYGVCNNEKGAVYGEKGLVSDALCSRSVVAAKPSICYSLNREEFNTSCGLPWAARMYEMSLHECLRQSTAFPIRSNFNEMCIHWLAEQLVPIVHEPGEEVFMQGENNDKSIFFIRTGHAFMKGGDIPENKVVRLSESDMFGEAALLFDCPREVTVRCGKECKKCTGLGTIGAKRFNCNRCGCSGARTDGPLVVLYQLSELDFTTFLELPNPDSGLPGGVLQVMREQVMRRVLLTQYPDMEWKYGDLGALTSGFEYRKIAAGDEVVIEGQEWPNFSIVMEGMIKCFENNLLLGEVGPSGCASTLENLVAPLTMTAPDNLLLAILSRDSVRRLVHPETSKKLVGGSVDRHQAYLYKNIAALSDGNWGRIWLVEDREGQKFAMHTIKKEVIEMHEGFELRCQGEAAVATRREVYELVDHPFVCQLTATGLDKRNLYMWTEFVQGGSLELHLQQHGTLTPAAALFYVGGVALAMEQMHIRRVVHRDLQPCNILLSLSGFPKVAGMGRARKVTHKTFTICGSPQYMPPEMIQKAGYNKSIDFWQLGCLCYHLMCGHAPFAAAARDNTSSVQPNGMVQTMPVLFNEITDKINQPYLALTHRIMHGSVAFPWQIPIKMHHFIRALLEPNPELRLGMQRRETRDIYEHTCYEGFDWKALKEQKLKPPIRPVAHGPDDLRNFPERPTKTAKEGKTSTWVPDFW